MNKTSAEEWGLACRGREEEVSTGILLSFHKKRPERAQIGMETVGVL